MNRSAKQLTLFDGPADYDAFLNVLGEAESVCPIRLLEYCVMPNHWHLLVWPERDDQLARYMRWITGVHGQRWRRARAQQGKGAVYQGRYRWVAVQDGTHYDVARRYIVQNPVRGRLVDQPEDWPWSSASSLPVLARPTLADGPRPRSEDRPHSTEPLLDAVTAERMRSSLRNGQPFGDPRWSRTLEVRSWLIAVLQADSKAVAAGSPKNTNEIANSQGWS